MAFLKQEKPKQFRYIPRFYDEAREDLEIRIRRVDEELNKEETGEYVPNLKGQFKKRHEALYGPPGNAKSNKLGRWFILLIYFGLIIAIIYLVINILSKVI